MRQGRHQFQAVPLVRELVLLLAEVIVLTGAVVLVKLSVVVVVPNGALALVKVDVQVAVQEIRLLT